MGRFISSDTYPSTGQGLLGNNMFAYCNNSPVMHKDTSGNALDTVLDFISLGTSIAEVALNPADPWAWMGIIGDVVDVAIPFVGGVGETMRLCGAIQGTTEVVSAAQKAKSMVSKSTGVYDIAYKSGKHYVGKGSFDRAITSAKNHAKGIELNDLLGDEVLSITWTSSKNSREAFMLEYLWQHKGEKVLSAKEYGETYNMIWSPGRKYLGWK
mgnify:CR=1 FL=1